jgi:hypothetical protein
MIRGQNFGDLPPGTLNGVDCPQSGEVAKTIRSDIIKGTTPASGGGVNLVDVVTNSERRPRHQLGYST